MIRIPLDAKKDYLKDTLKTAFELFRGGIVIDA